jgi:predicted MFS family arabinose efflux permease
MVGIGTVTMISAKSGQYGLAGALVAVLAIAGAVLAPLVSTAVDRFGQFKVLPVASLVAGIGIAGMLVAYGMGAPEWTWFAFAILAGAIPSFGAMSRARWAHIYRGSTELHTAFAFESIFDELVFIVGPLIAITLSTTLFPEAGPLAGLGALIIGSIAFCAQRRTEPPVEPVRHTGGSILRLPIMWVLIINMLAMGTVFGIADVTTVAFAGNIGMPGMAGVILAVWGVASGTAGFIFGARRISMPLHWQLVIGTSILTVALIPLGLATNVLQLSAACLLAGICIAPLMIIANASVEKSVPVSSLTQGMTWMVTGQAAGIALGSSLGGQIIDSSGTSASYGAACVMMAIVTIVTLCLFAKRSVRIKHASSTKQMEPLP